MLSSWNTETYSTVEKSHYLRKEIFSLFFSFLSNISKNYFFNKEHFFHNNLKIYLLQILEKLTVLSSTHVFKIRINFLLKNIIKCYERNNFIHIYIIYIYTYTHTHTHTHTHIYIYIINKICSNSIVLIEV